METKQRFNFIDVLKGLGILLVILEHCIVHSENPVARFLLSFHMPLFFFVSGYLYKTSNESDVYFSRKVMSLLFPLIVYQLINSILYIGTSKFSGGVYTR